MSSDLIIIGVLKHANILQMAYKYDRPIEPWDFWTQGDLSNGPNTPWVLGYLRPIRYFD